MDHILGDRGFTIIEILSVMLIIGIVSAIAISRIGSSQVELSAKTEVVKSHLRYAQLKAMNSNTVWGICCDNVSYWLFKDGDLNQKMVLPGEELNLVDLSANDISMAAFTAAFDSWGRPYNNASATGVSTGATISVDAEGAVPVNITIIAETGFIP
jgi:prepilin-type N-terminal cleavage/methylation domain-containing protein